MSNQRESRDTGLVIHRWLQWVATGGITILSALVISGMGTWDEFKAFMYKMEDVPKDIKEIKADVGDLRDETTGLKYRMGTLEQNTKHRK